MDKLQAMRSFRRVAELGSFAAAARDLGASNAAVSKHVRQLEEDLGTRLLIRTTRRLSLTEIGEAYLLQVQRILDELAEADEAVRGLHSEPRGHLRVNVPMSFGLQHVAPVLPSFLKRYPDLEVDISFTDRVVDLVEERVDLALRIRTSLPDSTLVAQSLAPVRRVVCASAGYVERSGAPMEPEDLSRHDCIVYSLSEMPDRWVFAGNPVREVTVRGQLRANSSLAIREALIAGQGVGLMTTFTVGDDLRDGRLVKLLDGWEPLSHTLFAVYPPGRHISAKVRLFIDHLREAYGAPPRWDEGL